MITLTTDLGQRDYYVAAVKAVILSINPKITLLDISHDIAAGDVLQGAFVLGQAFRYFPPDTIHLAIVDPGVGSKRKAVLLATSSGYFIAPDNGLLSFVLEEVCPGGKTQPPTPFSGKRPVLKEKPLPPGVKAISLSNPAFWVTPVSRTFHGRDIFAPVAAHLSLGVPPEELGEQVSALLAFHPFRAMTEGSTLIGQVMYIDKFGNLVTSIKEADLPQGNINVWVGGREIHGLSLCYQEEKGLMAIVGSSGYLEVSLANGNASASLGVRIGDEVRVCSSP